MFDKYLKNSQVILIALIWVIYPIVFLVLQTMLGLIVSAFGLIPVIVAGWLFGKRGGLIGALS